MCVRLSVRRVVALAMAAAALSDTRGLAQTSWRVQQISVPGFAQDPFTDGHAVVWSDGNGVQRYVDGVQKTLAPAGSLPVVYGDRYAWLGRDASISNGANTLVYDDGTGPKVVLAAQPDTDPLPRIYGLWQRPSLTGDHLVFNYAWTQDLRHIKGQVGLYANGILTNPLNTPPELYFGGPSSSSTNGSRVVWSEEGTTPIPGQSAVFLWENGNRSMIATPFSGPTVAITTTGHVFYTAQTSGSSSNVVRYTYATQVSEVVGQSRSVNARATWAAENRVIFTGTAGDLVLWDSGSSTSLGYDASWASVSSRNVAWFNFASGTSVEVLLYDGIATRLLGSYELPFTQPTLAVSDSLVTWNVWDGNLYVATAVPEPSLLFSLAAGLTIGCYRLLRQRITDN